MAENSLLERILWTQLARLVHGAPPAWEPESASARTIRGVLEARALDPEEAGIVERWDEQRESSRRLFDRLLQARVNRALREGLRVEAQRLGLSALPRIPCVLVARDGVRDAGRTATAPVRGNPRKTIVEFLSSGSVDVAELAPGAKLDELVELLVLANQDATVSLGMTLGPDATVVHPEGAAGEAPRVDLLLAGQSPSIQVFDVERELARLEEVLRGAIPPERRPAKSAGKWSFGQDLTGELLGGKYRIKALKGKGAFKTVYEGEDEMLGARVAVAVLNPMGARSPRALEHFQDEARKLTTLDHENIVRWITFDRTAEGLHYFVMEYLDGEELEKVLRREGRLAPKRVAAIVLQVLSALRRAHAKGKHGSLLHLDLKPENSFVLPPLAPGEPERVKVIDFGIGQHVGAEVRAAERPELRSLYELPAEELGKSIGSLALPEDEEPEERGPPSVAPGARRRVQRARGGTLLYASPEQCKHLAGHKDIEPLDGRSDLYSLGVMAFRMLTGQFPFERIASAHQAIQNHLEVAPRKVGSLGIKIPRDLAAFVDRCLVKEREKRWQDANEAYEALERILHPRLSPLKVAVPIALVAVSGFGALYYTRDVAAGGLTLVDPAIESVSERVVQGLHLGPKKPSRVLRLESDSAWDPAARVRLLDAASGKELDGWSVRWADGKASTIEIARLDGAKSAAALLEVHAGKRERWRSQRLALEHLGPWRIVSATVDGHDPARRLDPRLRELALELGGDPEGRAALQSIEVWCEGASLGRTSAVSTATQGDLARYRGPALDALFTGAEREVALDVVARDRAGQEEATTVTLRLAGDAADFGRSTGFVAKVESGSARLTLLGQDQMLLPESALCIEATAAARLRVFLEPAREALLARDVVAGAPLLLPLSELGIAGNEEHAGTLRLELDDSPWVDRATPEARTRRLSFRFTPRAPALEVQLAAPGLERTLVELDPSEATNHVNVGPVARLLVRPPPGTNLWIEASCRSESGAEVAPLRLDRANGPFELPLELAAQGTYRITLQKYLLLAGDERGPQIPPEHAFRIQVDRTAPEVELVLAGAEGALGGEEPLFLREFSQRITARLSDPDLESLRWVLTLPDGTRREDVLEPASEVVLPSLLAHQEAEGRYTLELVARDRAGNERHEPRAWQVARTGPVLALLEPLASGEERTWVLSERPWNVRVRASDANGVASVGARVVYRGRAISELELVRAAGELWELRESDRPSAQTWWAGEELALELTATDGAALASERRERGLVPDLPRAHELVIEPRGRPGLEPGDGVMVEIVAGGDYVFGGRSGEGQRPWNVQLPRDGLPTFFLDAREVSRREFLAFLGAEGGYAAARWWPDGSGPSAERAAAIASQLAGEPTLAATGVTWPEACAYAAWCGKRLPTLPEWEFAVRGHDYREFPATGTPPGAPADWPANLCSGAREWTATPERLVAALDFPSQCKLYPELLLAPSRPSAGGDPVAASSTPAAPVPRSGSHWVTGSLTGEAPSWSARTPRADAGHADIGFRCALDRERAHSLLDRGEYVTAE